ncbi:hypothetical protein JQ604_06930 [Bradyrhizobium jicamae]|uniref:hypothetical protein n=1 Tax=Bradyrhizobium jicamae TaxID=280332 RepID=UPI001BA9EEF9|nr:hypothetical protein [Bradyrhizobium jicamae]MBR0751912.1 hypothetical protein [Bradyrhizobium jicamae]
MDVVMLVRMQTRLANSPKPLRIALIGDCVALPIIIGYIGFSYRVFRGKTIELDYA